MIVLRRIEAHEGRIASRTADQASASAIPSTVRIRGPLHRSRAFRRSAWPTRRNFHSRRVALIASPKSGSEHHFIDSHRPPARLPPSQQNLIELRSLNSPSAVAAFLGRGRLAAFKGDYFSSCSSAKFSKASATIAEPARPSRIAGIAPAFCQPPQVTLTDGQGRGGFTWGQKRIWPAISEIVAVIVDCSDLFPAAPCAAVRSKYYRSQARCDGAC